LEKENEKKYGKKSHLEKNLTIEFPPNNLHVTELGARNFSQ